MVSEETALVVSRQLLHDFATTLNTLDDPKQKHLAHFALEQIQPRVVSFEDQVSVIRENLSKLYEAEEDWAEAARILQGIPLESSHRLFPLILFFHTALALSVPLSLSLSLYSFLSLSL